MANGKQGSSRSARWLRWISRIAGTLVAGFWLSMGILSAIFEREPWTVEGFIMASLIVASAVGVGLAWWRARLGGIVLLLVGVAHCIFALVEARHNVAFAVLISGVPYLIVGALFLLAWRGSQT